MSEGQEDNDNMSNQLGQKSEVRLLTSRSFPAVSACSWQAAEVGPGGSERMTKDGKRAARLLQSHVVTVVSLSVAFRLQSGLEASSWQLTHLHC